MKIAIVGSRTFCDRGLVISIVRSTFVSGDILISGGAKGVDTWGEETLPILNAELAVLGCRPIEKQIFLPDWDKHGKSAGFIRNKLIIDSADLVVAFWDGKSKGTKSSIDLAINAGKPVDIYIRKT